MVNGLIFEDKCQNDPVCSICNHEMDDSIHRIIYFGDPKKTLFSRRFHFFFPCWDVELISQRYVHHKIISAGFSCEENILYDSNIVKSLQRNSSLWE